MVGGKELMLMFMSIPWMDAAMLGLRSLIITATVVMAFILMLGALGKFRL
jgi:hypothetical protein